MGRPTLQLPFVETNVEAIQQQPKIFERSEYHPVREAKAYTNSKPILPVDQFPFFNNYPTGYR